MSSCNECVEDSAVEDRGADEPSSVDDAILDAARGCVLDFGVRRSTLAEVARRAGVSRPTVYRRWPDMRAVVGDLLTREIRANLPTPVLGVGPARAALVATAVRSCALIRSHPLFEKIYRTDPEIMMTYISDRLGTSQRALIELLATGITAGQADGSIRAGVPTEMAAMLLLICQSAVQSASMIAELLGRPALDEQLGFAIDGYLRPSATDHDHMTKGDAHA
ncbi:TetR/AcrR family transcriptional regulator [Rhodococcus sp. D2-41]|uniref:TetR/AcrR family transcriptional regulator n=1 Tax=Speluncibacter jeojiensis TaxID=2710754 RepID=A0A9X4M3R1_9ACTN|nr:TetR/AcrR family transcriptional regulator [Rhodococcus sp. D2-41]MDG3010902.1 TetR/AcrR family transcriptional regulator [Rhodococcus sp. D2-41]MDG3013876.1 TetR/AcrR family transcriptional regulator [Corynebacteriales bacterium D3-21]